jgi:hypothetical protein
LGLAVAIAASACKTTSDHAAVKDDGAGGDSADHGCQIVMTNASWNPIPTGNYWSFLIDVRSGTASQLADDAVQVHYSFNGGGWQDVAASAAPNQPGGDWVRYTATLPWSQGADRAMGMHVVAYAQMDTGRLYDHNFEGGDTGNVALVQSNNWNVRHLSPQCHAPDN